MPISTIDPRALRTLTPGQIADLALQADQERRRQEKLGNAAEAAAWQAEMERLTTVFDRAA